MQTQAMYSDFSALAGLRSEARRDAGAALEDVAAQFESLFVQIMLEAMRDATPKGGLFESDQMESYQQMYDQQLSLDLSKRGGIGLAKVLVEQLGGDSAQDDSNAANGAGIGGLPLDKPAALNAMDMRAYLSRPLPTMSTTPATAITPAVPASWTSSSAEDFVTRLRPLAEGAAERLGVAPNVLLAQAALETGWGKHLAADERGSSNNFFNIKAGSEWPGRTVSVSTLEFRDGVAVRETARMRAYPSAASSFSDYATLIAGSPRYEQAIAEGPSGEGYLRALQRAGYATDPDYADKVMAILKQDDLAGVSAQLKEPTQLPL